MIKQNGEIWPSVRPAQLLAFIGRSQVDGINYSSLSKNLGITKYKAEQYAEAFEQAFVLQRIFPAGTNVLREPKVLLMPPIRLLHRPMDEAQGGLREDFFAMAMRQVGIPIQYLKSTTGQKTPDFLIEHHGRKIVFEIGGKGKSRSQFKGVQADQKNYPCSRCLAFWKMHSPASLGFYLVRLPPRSGRLQPPEIFRSRINDRPTAIFNIIGFPSTGWKLITDSGKIGLNSK
jgi:hypothetical protein